MIKILLVDDNHALIREGLRGVLDTLGDKATVFEAEDARQAMLLLEKHADLDILLLDLVLPDQHGFDVLTKVRERYPTIPIVILSQFDDRNTVVKALKLGALGFIPKSAGLKIIQAALQLILSGGTYVPPHVLSGGEFLAAHPTRKQVLGDLNTTSPLKGGLTGQQMRVLALMMQGKSNKEIGNELHLSERTIKAHVTPILKALHVKNRTAAVLAVSELGWAFPRSTKSNTRPSGQS